MLLRNIINKLYEIICMSFNMYLKSKNANTNSEKLVFLQTDKIDEKTKFSRNNCEKKRLIFYVLLNKWFKAYIFNDTSLFTGTKHRL